MIIQSKVVMREKMILLLFVLVFCVQGIYPDDTIVTLPNGKIQGYVSTTYRIGKTFYAFLGIPFAAPPIGNLRFKPPQPLKNWTGVLPTKALTKTCYQINNPLPTETEDCLYLDVFTPVKPGSSPSLPVMIEIPSGGFISGTATKGDMVPQNFLEKDIIVVSPSYRVGPFGFLSTGDMVIPGNMGLKDQQFALEWVNKNIHLFGGDPKKVAITGGSSGGASVTYHLLNPKSAGLYRAAFAQSASALSRWANQINPLDFAYGIATHINPSFGRHRSTRELHDFLMTANASAIIKAETRFGSLVPVVEVPHEGAFISEPMHELLKRGKINKVPLFIGHNSEELISRLNDLPSWKQSVKNLVPRNLVQPELRLKDESERLIAGEKIRNIYTNTSFEYHLGKAVQYTSDLEFIRSVVRFADLASHHTDVYFYQFSFQGKICDNGLSNEGVSGVGHGEEAWYLWSRLRNLTSYPEADVRTTDRFISLVSNFVKHLNPTPEKNELVNVILPKMTPKDMYYIDIGKDLVVKKNPREFSYRKWVEIFEEYGRPPFTSF